MRVPRAAPVAAPSEAPEATGSQLSQIAALLRGEPVGEPETQTPDDPLAELAEPAPSAPKAPAAASVSTVADVAARLGVDAADVYGIQVTTRDGETVTLGALKDHYQARADGDLERLAWEEQRIAERAELETNRQELAELLSAVPRDKLNPAIVEQVRRTHEVRMTAEREKLVERMPAWRDDTVRNRELDKISEHLKQYGIPRAVLDSLTDHRLVVYMHDNMARKARVDAALEQARAVRPAPPPPASGRQPTKPTGSTRTGRQNAPMHGAAVHAISKLLRGE